MIEIVHTFLVVYTAQDRTDPAQKAFDAALGSFA
jgi:hypothetical protein